MPKAMYLQEPEWGAWVTCPSGAFDEMRKAYVTLCYAEYRSVRYSFDGLRVRLTHHRRGSSEVYAVGKRGIGVNLKTFNSYQARIIRTEADETAKLRNPDNLLEHWMIGTSTKSIDKAMYDLGIGLARHARSDKEHPVWNLISTHISLKAKERRNA